MKTAPTLSLILLICLGASPAALAQGSVNPATLDHASQDLIIERLMKRIEDFYVLQEDAPGLAEHIQERHREGAYRALTDPNQFARQIMLNLREESRDAHFALLFDPAMYQTMEAELGALNGPDSRAALAGWLQDDDAAPDIGSLAGSARTNYFFRRLEVLEGNVGYLRLDQIPALEAAKPTVDAAMAFLTNVDAMIIDVRGNRGGVGGFIPYFMSYFFPEGETYLYKRDFEAVGVVDEYFTIADLPGERLDGVPLYVLIDPETGSAARNLAYTLQSFERGLLVGEPSGDSGAQGAHSGGLFPLAHGVLGIVPIGRVVNARTNSNWRETGVQPDIEVGSVDALDEAHRLALQALLEQSNDPAIGAELNEALENIARRRAAASAPPADLAEFVGTYGQRTISLAGGVLKYQRQGMGARLDMREIEDDLFELVLPAGARAAQPPPNVRFDRDEAGDIVGFTLIGQDGTLMESAPRGPEE